MPSPPNLILPNRQANQAGFYGSGQIWSVGGMVGQTFQFLAEVQRRSNGGGPCGTPYGNAHIHSDGDCDGNATHTPTATATATASIHANGDSDGNCRIHADSDSNRNIYCNSDSTATATANCDRTAAAFTDATATADTAGAMRAAIALLVLTAPGYPRAITLTCIECFEHDGGKSWLRRVWGAIRPVRDLRGTRERTSRVPAHGRRASVSHSATVHRKVPRFPGSGLESRCVLGDAGSATRSRLRV